MKIRKAPHCPEMERLLGKLPAWLFWAGAAVLVYLALLLLAGSVLLEL